MEENEDVSVDAGRGAPHRRTVLKGAAWSIPVIAAAAAVPAYAASPAGCGPAETGSLTITGTGANHAMQSVTLPKCARTVTYTVIGGNGGVDSLRGVYPESFAAAGAAVTGVFQVQGGETLTLVAGGGGRGSSHYTVAQQPVVRATGYGNGGVGGNRDDRMIGGGGGAGSAIMLGPGWTGVANPLVVAGGGGGTGTERLQAGGTGNPVYSIYRPDGDPYSAGGSAGLTAGRGATRGVRETWPGSALHIAYGGQGATSTGPGAGGTYVAGAGGTTVVGGANGNPGAGSAGGDGVNSGFIAVAEGWDVYGSGGGGGGYTGGGSGAIVYTSPNSAASATSGAFGGAGSSYFGGSTPTSSATNGTVTVLYPSSITQSPTPRYTRRDYNDPAAPFQYSVDGNPGSVTISWS